MSKTIEISDKWLKRLLKAGVVIEIETPDKIEATTEEKDRAAEMSSIKSIADGDSRLISLVKEAKSIGIFDNDIIPINRTRPLTVKGNYDIKVDKWNGMECLELSINTSYFDLFAGSSMYTEKYILCLNGKWAEIVKKEDNVKTKKK